MFGFEIAKGVLIHKIEREATGNAACALELMANAQSQDIRTRK